MTDCVTPRLTLPLLAAGQAEKEMTHNEALVRLDLLVQSAVVAAGTNMPPDAATPGQCWIVGSMPTGAWQGRADAIAGWTAGGWRFAAPAPGCAAWNISSSLPMVYLDGEWRAGELNGSRVVIDGERVVGPRAAPIADPAGTGIVDAEARITLSAILGALRGHGLIADNGVANRPQ